MSDKKVTIDLRSAVNEILKEYGDEVNEIIEESARKTIKKAVSTLKNSNTGAFKNRTGEYRKGWVGKVEKSNLSVTAIAYNKNKPQLTFLLENGHALVKGGRTLGNVKAYEHIAPVNEQAQKDFIEYIEEGIS